MDAHRLIGQFHSLFELRSFQLFYLINRELPALSTCHFSASARFHTTWLLRSQPRRLREIFDRLQSSHTPYELSSCEPSPRVLASTLGRCMQAVEMTENYPQSNGFGHDIASYTYWLYATASQPAGRTHRAYRNNIFSSCVMSESFWTAKIPLCLHTAFTYWAASI